MPRRVRRHRLKNLALTGVWLGAIVATAAAVGWVLAGVAGAVVIVASGALVAALAPAPAMERALFRQGARRVYAPWLEDAVAQLAARAGIEPPVLLVLPAPVPQAFATEGRHGAAIALTPALLERLTPREVIAVVAHELAHLAAGDLGLMRLAALLGGLTRSLAQIGFFLLLIALPLTLAAGVPIPWPSVLALSAAPWLIHFMSLALSRLREHDADAAAVELTGDPLALASALVKIEAAASGSFWARLFRFDVPERWRTHPRTEARVLRLREMAG
ncbi:MAG: M48 family metalloprotease [Sandaracinaceae bacterium]|nr:M48 family metalloprotease [Sandaracinaceae bacterium]